MWGKRSEFWCPLIRIFSLFLSNSIKNYLEGFGMFQSSLEAPWDCFFLYLLYTFVRFLIDFGRLHYTFCLHICHNVDQVCQECQWTDWYTSGFSLGALCLHFDYTLLHYTSLHSYTWPHCICYTLLHFVYIHILHSTSLQLLHFTTPLSTPLSTLLCYTLSTLLSYTWLDYICYTRLHFATLHLLRFVYTLTLHFARPYLLHFVYTLILHSATLHLLHFVYTRTLHFPTLWSYTWLDYICYTWLHFYLHSDPTLSYTILATLYLHLNRLHLLHFTTLLSTLWPYTLLHYTCYTLSTLWPYTLSTLLCYTWLHYICYTWLHFCLHSDPTLCYTTLCLHSYPTLLYTLLCTP